MDRRQSAAHEADINSSVVPDREDLELQPAWRKNISNAVSTWQAARARIREAAWCFRV